MKIVIAPDSYKKSLTALEVATHIKAGCREIFPDACYVKVPVADGVKSILIGITGSLTPDVGVVHQHGMDAACADPPDKTGGGAALARPTKNVFVR